MGGYLKSSLCERVLHPATLGRQDGTTQAGAPPLQYGLVQSNTAEVLDLACVDIVSTGLCLEVVS